MTITVTSLIASCIGWIIGGFVIDLIRRDSENPWRQTKSSIDVLAFVVTVIVLAWIRSGS